MERRSDFKFKRLIDWWDYIEKKAAKLLVLLFLLLVIVQALLTNQTCKGILCAADRLEGKSISDSQPAVKTGKLELSVFSSNNAFSADIYINGEKAAVTAQNTTSLTVHNNDVIEISGVKYKKTFGVQITKTTDNVTVPELGRTLTVSNNLVYLCRVKLKGE